MSQEPVSVADGDPVLPGRKPKPFWLILKALLSIGLLWWLVVESGADWTQLQNLTAGHLLTALGLLLVQVVLFAWRWHFVLAAGELNLPVPRALGIGWMAAFFNLLLPASVGGDAVRIFYAHREGLAVKPLIGAALIDRIIALFALAVLILLTLPWVDALIADMTVKIVLVAIAVPGALGMLFLLYLQPLLARWQERRWARILAYPSHWARLVMLRPRSCAAAVGLSLAVHALSCLSVWVIASDLGAPLSLMQALILVPPVILALTLPISLGGWGVREAAMVAALAGIGVAPAAALIVSLTHGLLGTIAALPGALFWFLYRRRA